MSKLHNPTDNYSSIPFKRMLAMFLFVFIKQISFAQSGATISTSGSTQICSGNTIVLSINNAPVGASYQWIRNKTEITGEISDKLTATASGKYSAVITYSSQKDTLNEIQITKVADATLNGTGATIINGQPYFKTCSAIGQNFSFTNASTTTSGNTKYIIKWGDGTADYVSNTFNGVVNHLFPIGTRKMTFIVYAGSCIDSTVYTVFVGNIPAGGLVGIGGSTICSKNEQQFIIAGTKNNPPGTMYIMSYNDGSKRDTFYHPAPDTVSHAFDTSSCGFTSSNGIRTFPNSFGAFLTIVNPCGSAGGSILPIYVSDRPKPEITVRPSDTSCVNQVLTITNTTRLTYNVENGNCTPVKFIWRINALTPGGAWTLTSGSLGNDFGSGDPNVWTAGTQNIKPRFTVVGTYSVKLIMINSTLCGADSIEKIICINPLPTAAATAEITSGCAPLTVKAFGNTNTPICGENKFSWTVVYAKNQGCLPENASFIYVNGTNSLSQNPQLQFNNPGIYKLRLQVIAPDSGCTSEIREIDIEVKSKPVVSLTTPTQICLNEKIRPSVNANCYSTNAVYQWTFKGAVNESFSGILPDSVAYANAGNYLIKVGVTNECGTTDSVRQLTVKPLPVMIQPIDIVVCSGASVNIASFTSSLSNTVFNWTNDQPFIGLSASGTGNITSFKAINSTTNPIKATIRVTPVINGCIGDAKIFTITVMNLPGTPTVNNFEYCQFDVALPLSVLPVDGNILRWYNLQNGGSFSLMTPTPSTSLDGTQIYYVSQFNQITGCESPRAAIEVRVNPKPVVQNITREVCSNTSFEFNPTSTVAGTVYSWSTPELTSGLIGGSAAFNQSVIKGQLKNNTNFNQTATYAITPSTGKCAGNVFNLTVLVKPVADIKKKEITICSGKNFSIKPVDAENNDRVPAGTNYSWNTPVLSPVGIIAGTSPSPSAQNQISQTLFNNSSEPATATYTVFAKTGGESGCFSDSFIIAVNVTPRAKIQKQTVTICSKTSFNVIPANKVDGNVVPQNTKYIWSEPVVTPTGSVIGGSAQAIPQSSISQNLENITTATVMVVYKVTPLTGSEPTCDGDVFEVVVYVNPQVGISDQQTEICSGEIFGVIPSGAPVYTTYTWSAPDSNPAGAVKGGFAQSIPQKAISQQLHNTTNQTAILTYTVFPKTGNCTDATFNVNVKVFAKPFIKDTSLQICTETSIIYKPVNQFAGAIVPANTTYTWGNPVISPAGAVSGFSSQAVPQYEFLQTLINNTNAPATITYTLTAYSGAEGNCISKPFKVTLTVQPNAKAVMNFNKQINCAPFGLNTTNVLNASPATASNSYQWLTNGILAGTQRDFPGYNITRANDSVLVQLIANSDYGCKNDTVKTMFYTSPLPNAMFTASVDTVCGVAMILVKNTSVLSNLLAYRWDFGNGQSSSIYQPDSIRYRPSVNYGDTTYTIRLSVISSCDTVTYSKTVVIRSAPKASFITNRVTGCSPVEVLFNNTSRGIDNSYEWNFGDGTAVVMQQKTDTITHWYYSGVVAVFNATLTVRNHCGSDVVKVPMNISPNLIKLEVVTDANFTKGCTPLTVKFVNKSTGSNSYKWDFGDGNVITRTNGTDTIYHTYLGLGKFDTRVFSSNGCSDTSLYITAVQTFTAPVAAFSSDKQSVCRGESIQFTNQSQNAAVYTWNFGNGARLANINPSYAYNTGGSFNVSLIAAIQHAPGVVCKDTFTRVVTVKDSASAAMILNRDKGSCTPFIVDFQQPVSNVVSAIWDFGDGNTSDELNPTHAYNKNGNYSASVSVRTDAGCTYVSAKTISVVAPEGIVRMKSGIQCLDVPVQINATAFNTDSIEWNFGDGNKVTTANVGVAYHTYQNPGVYIPKVSLKNNSGCIYRIMPDDTIRVEQIQTGFKTVVDKSCGYTDVQFLDTTRAVYGVNQIQWNLGDGSTATGNSFKHRYTVGGNYQIRMETKGNAGCNDTAAYVIKVDVSQKPQAVIFTEKTTCTNWMTQFISKSQSTDLINYHKWQISNGYQSNSQDFDYRFNAAGIYRVTLIAGTEQLCFDTTKMDIEVLMSPSVKVNNDITICREKSVNLQAYGASLYNWYPADGLNCASCSSTIAKPFVTTQYVVKGTASNGCYSYDTVNISVKQPFVINVNKSDSICIGSSIQLSAFGAESYTWLPTTGLSNPLAGSPLATPTISTTYRVIGSDNICFTDTAYVRIGVGKIPSIELGDDQVLNTGAPYKIKPIITNGPIKSWSWTPANDLSCSDCAEPIAAPGDNKSYVATATTNYGCIAKDTISFKVFCENSQVFIPNGFTPDGDGINDVVMVRARGISKVRYFRIFNRWGEMVYERYNFQPNDPANGWDGKIKGQASMPAVYVYIAEVECSNGTPFTYKGNITLIK